ncbi:hypothetical protein [Paenibacillus assamensis]|uniref:hypothetical protein n=1 Tax=Paenibacillus assamensis TaxID=311244 RepID=UPI00040DF647
MREISIDILANYTFTNKVKIALTFASDLGYATTTVDTQGVIFRDNKILLISEKIDGAWALEGGTDIDFSPSKIVVKGVKEESGFDVVAIHLLAIMDKNHPPEPYHVYKLFICFEIVGCEAIVSLKQAPLSF